MLTLDFMIWFSLSTTASQCWYNSRGTSRCQCQWSVRLSLTSVLSSLFPSRRCLASNVAKLLSPRPFPVHLRRRARPRFLVFILDTQVRPSRLLAPFLFFSGRDWTRSGHSTAGLEAAGTPEILRTTQPFY